MPTPLLNNDSPHERLYGCLCDLSSLHTFACLCYVNNLNLHRKKFDRRAISGTFLGFRPNTKGYLYLNLNNQKIEVSRNIVFYETHFPYHVQSSTSHDNNSLSLPIPANYNNDYGNLESSFPFPDTTTSTANDTTNTDIATSDNDADIPHTDNTDTALT
ncbi:hypothetical protein VIGAN_05135700 [Vigna angularis var. angularis]|uniref:Retroviral polymerase SH3-like domain-containing protein n=1 Tax=Vigna angularis var. angularis TaxID=157739 RepID=A0A0S3S503_PHAAN|nr:hypothetical protein VIGAN_05135700 [Vigna angularis var. angularis]